MTTYAATVTRTELGLSTLSIHDGTAANKTDQFVVE